MPTIWRLVVAFLAAVSAVACSGGGDRGLGLPADTPVVLISVDTLRSDRLPAYGYDVIETPAIDRLRRDGVLFERAYTNVPLTLPAHVSLLSGVLPFAHGVRDNLGYTVDAGAAPLLQQVLKGAGFATGAAVSAYVLRRATGIDAGFDFYDDAVEHTTGPGIQAIQRSGAATLEAVLPWLRSAAGGPLFLLFHIFEPHSPYQAPEPFASRYDSPYDAEVAAADKVVGDLLDELDGLGLYDRALIFFLSDHGEGLGEHGEDEHGLFLYRSTLQVPLIVKLPRAARAGETITHPVQLVDIHPTVTSALGLPQDGRLAGRPLFEPVGAGEPAPPIYAETFFPRLHFGWSDLAALIADRHNYIEAPRPELYDLVDDPDQQHNLIEKEPARAAELRTALAAYDRSLEAPASTDPETRRRLEALGYVGQASTGGGDALPDPKDGVGSLAEIRRAYGLYAEGAYEQAAAAFTDIVGQHPGIEDAWEYLALAQLGLGRMDDAVATYHAAIEALPDSSRLSMRLALLLFRMGRLDEAYVQANLAMSSDAAAAHVLLARIAFSRGDLETAESEAREAMAVDDRLPGPYLVLADVEVARGEAPAAARLLAQALADGIGDDPVRAKLASTHIWMADPDAAAAVLVGFEDSRDLDILMAFGRLANARQQWGEARRWFGRALEIDPGNPNALLNLGIALVAEGSVAEARPLLERAVTAIPGSFEGWNALGVGCARQGDVGAAIAAWERARQINPDALELLFNLGLVHAQAGHLVEAIGFFEAFAGRAEPGPQRDRALALAQRLRARASQER